MKKIIVIFSCLLAAVWGQAEQMNFVTTLSSPMGTFAQLETADSAVVTTSPIVNFCTTKASVGTVLVNGANAYLQVLNLKNGTTLGGNTPEYRVSGALNSLNSGQITGGRLMASGVTVENSTDPKSKVDQKLYLASGKVKGARTDSLTIPGKVQTAANGDGTTGTDLHWSNVYGRDYSCSGNSCSETGSSYTTYLIKSKAASAPTDPCLDSNYKWNHRAECCQTAYTSDDVCYYDCPSEYKWQSDGYESVVVDTPKLQQWFGRTDWVEQACRAASGSSYTCNGTLVHDCWNPFSLNPSFKLEIRAVNHNVNTAQPESIFGNCNRVGDKALLLWGNTYTGWFAEEIMCQYGLRKYSLYANAYYYICQNKASGQRCKNGW